MEPERSIVAAESLHAIAGHLLATKLRGSGLEEHIEVIARIEAEHEQRLITVFRIRAAQFPASTARRASARGVEPP